MDIESLYTVEAHEAGAEMQVKDDSGKPLDMYITLMGIDSKAWRKIVSQLSRNLVNDVDTEEAESESLSQATIGWRGFTSKGKALDFSKESVKQLYLNAPYIRKQADMFIADRANFTKGREAS